MFSWAHSKEHADYCIGRLLYGILEGKSPRVEIMATREVSDYSLRFPVYGLEDSFHPWLSLKVDY